MQEMTPLSKSSSDLQSVALYKVQPDINKGHDDPDLCTEFIKLTLTSLERKGR